MCSRNKSIPQFLNGAVGDAHGAWMSLGFGQLATPSLLTVLCIGEKYGFYSWPTKEILVFNEPSSSTPGAGKGTQRNVQRKLPKSWRKHCCLSPQTGLNRALLRNTWITWNLPGMETALCGLRGAGAEPGHGLWSLHLTWGSHVHLGSCQHCRNNHSYKPPAPPPPIPGYL